MQYARTEQEMRRDSIVRQFKENSRRIIVSAVVMIAWIGMISIAVWKGSAVIALPLGLFVAAPLWERWLRPLFRRKNEPPNNGGGDSD